MNCIRNPLKALISLHFLLLLFSGALQAQIYDGYTLYYPQNGTKAYLVDNSGTTYHTWTFSSSATSCYSTYMLAGGSLMRTVNHAGNSFSGGPVSGEVQKVSYSGTVLWDFVYSTADYCSHHDIHVMPNGNVLLICYERKTSAQATQAGCSQSIELWPEKIVEIQPSGSNGGNVVWEWHVWDHLCQNYNATKDNYVASISDHPELININYNTTKDWMHANGIDYNPTLDQIVFSSHNLNEIYVIDHSTTTAQAATHSGGNSGKGGDILYRWGNPAAYQTSGTTIFNIVHDAHWVPSNVPNYPNSLAAFNNKGGTGNKSCVDVFTPPYNGYNYTKVAGQPYTPATYNWRHTYSGTATQDMGSSHQLPNGNTLVCIAQSGYIYEINPGQTLVWSKTAGGMLPQSHKYPLCYITGTYSASATASPATVCAGNSSQLNVTVTGGVAYTYSWTSNPAGFTSTLQNPLVNPNVTTVYTVTVTNGPCSATGSVTVTVNPAPSVTTSATPPVICSGSGSQLNATATGGSGYSYYWTSNPPGFTSTLQNPVVSPTVNTFYTCAVTSSGCTSSSGSQVNVNTSPAVTATATPSVVCSGTQVQLNASVTGGSDPAFSWTSDPPGFTSDLQSPVVTPLETTTYSVTVTSNGCAASSSGTVAVNPRSLTLHLFLEGLYTGSGLMNPAYDEFGPRYGSNIADKITVELHNASDYGTIEYTCSPADLTTGGLLVINNIPGTYNGSYYITLKHRNSLETTTSAPVSLAACTVSYNFTTGASTAFGDNMSNWNGQGTYVIWCGDVNHDGIIDSGDINPVDNASTSITMGYADEDINGDGIVDSGDMNFVDNNSTAIIIAMTP